MVKTTWSSESYTSRLCERDSKQTKIFVEFLFFFQQWSEELTQELILFTPKVKD